MSDGGSGSGGSGFDWGLRPGGTPPEPEPELPPEEPALPPATPESLPAPARPNLFDPAPTFTAPVEPLPSPPPQEYVTQLMPITEQVDPFASVTDLFAPATESFAPATESFAPDSGLFGDPDSAIDALFGETQFREYEPGVLDPNERPFAGRAAQSTTGTSDEPVRIAGTQKVLLSVAGGLVAVLALVALFFVGTRLPAILNPAPAAVASAPATTPAATSTTKPVGPVANGVHPWTALLGGECLDPYTNPWAEKFTVVDCSKPHPAQMVFRGTFETSTDTGYPGVEKLQAQLSLLCAAPGVIDLAAAGAYSDAQVQGGYAVNDEEWAEGEHDYFCFVSRSSGQPLVGSVAAPRAPAAAPSP